MVGEREVRNQLPGPGLSRMNRSTRIVGSKPRFEICGQTDVSQSRVRSASQEIDIFHTSASRAIGQCTVYGKIRAEGEEPAYAKASARSFALISLRQSHWREPAEARRAKAGGATSLLRTRLWGQFPV